MDILQQCQKWNENDEYQKIIDALEAIPAKERTPEMDSELARACNNLADPTKPGGRDLLRKAISLLKPHEEYFAGDHCWNFRMGYAYFYLDQEAAPCGILKRRWRPVLAMRIRRSSSTGVRKAFPCLNF